LIAIYAGDQLEDLRLVAHGDSYLEFDAVGGMTYQIALDAQGLLPGPFGGILHAYLDPTNDAFATPLRLEGPQVHAMVTTDRATREVGEPLHGGQYGGRSVWFRWTADWDGPVYARAIPFLGISDGMALAVYQGDALSELQEVVAGVSIAVPEVAFAAKAGQTYRFAVDGNDGSVADFTFELFAVDLPPPDDALHHCRGVRRRRPTSPRKDRRPPGRD
jgi:hypothetical protein